MTAGVGETTVADAVPDRRVLAVFEAMLARMDRVVGRDLRRRGLPRNEVDDVLQEARLWIWQHMGQFTSLEHMDNAYRAVARNKATDRSKLHENRRAELRGQFADDALGLASDTADVVVRQQWCHEMLRAFRELPGETQQLLLAVAGGASYEDLAARHGRSVGAIRVRVHRARALLRRAARPSGMAGVLPALTVVPRQIRRLIGDLLRPASMTGRVTMSSAVIVVAAPFIFPPDLKLPVHVERYFRSNPQLPTQPESAAVLDGRGGAANDGVPRPSGVAVMPVEEGRQQGADRCVPTVGVCVAEQDDGPGAANDGERYGDWLCVNAADHCVGQEWVGVCPYGNVVVPSSVGRCDRYSEPFVDPPPPPDSEAPGVPPPPSPPAQAPAGRSPEGTVS